MIYRGRGKAFDLLESFVYGRDVVVILCDEGGSVGELIGPPQLCVIVSDVTEGEGEISPCRYGHVRPLEVSM